MNSVCKVLGVGATGEAQRRAANTGLKVQESGGLYDAAGV